MKYAQIQSYTVSQLQRLIGIDQATFTEMVSVVHAAEALKRKSGRPSKLCTEDQILLTLSYLREYRTLFHVAADYG
ncbi:MAG: transposase family protein, partial [Pseudomonadota bacterium]|nr:transposase family protein [Pseudomonadota bacterium]